VPLNVLSNFSSFTVDPDMLALLVGEDRAIVADAVPAPGRPPAGWPPVDPNDVTWSSLDPGTADVLVPEGQITSIGGVDRGATSVLAEFNYECEDLVAAAAVTVECQPVTFTVDPPAIKMLVGDSRLLTADATDQDSLPLDTTGVTWISADESVVSVGTPVGAHNFVEGNSPGSGPVAVTATYDDGCQTLEATSLVTVGCADLELSVTDGIVKVDAFLPIVATAVDSDGVPASIDENSITWSSSNPNIAAVIPSTGAFTTVVGIAPGNVTITAQFDEGPCNIRSASATIEVREDPSIAGLWHLTPVTQFEQCRYAGLDWFPEDDVSDFYVNILQPLGEDNSFITASYVPDTGLLLAGNWDRATGAFDLSVDTSDPAECGYQFYWDNGADLCGDAVNCQFVSCQNMTSIGGYTSSTADTLNADASWYYAVTFSFDTGVGTTGYNTWECEGIATLNGAR
jgi:hypothetical protein